jgi:hypothetical protein
MQRTLKVDELDEMIAGIESALAREPQCKCLLSVPVVLLTRSHGIHPTAHRTFTCAEAVAVASSDDVAVMVTS